MPVLEIGGRLLSAGGIIFDKDGTLHDTLAVMPKIITRRVNAITALLPEAAGLEEKLARSIGLFQGEIIRRSPAVVGSRLETAAAAAAVLYLERDLDWDRAISCVLQAFDDVDREIKSRDRFLLFPGVKETIKKLYRSGFRIAVATNDSLKPARDFLQYVGLEKYISAVACADELKQGKPHPGLALEAAARMDLRPGQCILFGDSIWDMEMGRRAKMLCTVGVLSGSATREELESGAEIIITGVANIIVGS